MHLCLFNSFSISDKDAKCVSPKINKKIKKINSSLNGKISFNNKYKKQIQTGNKIKLISKNLFGIIVL